MRKLMLFGGLLALAASPAFAQFEGGVNGLGDARQINMPTSQIWGGQAEPAPAAAVEERRGAGAGGAGEIKEKDRATLIRSTFVARRAIQIWIARFSTAIAASFTASDIVGCA